MEKQRTPIEVFDQVRETFPEEVILEHKGELNSVRESIVYASPENMGLHVRRFLSLFEEIVGIRPLPVDTPDWKIKAISVLTKENFDEIKEQIQSGTY